MKKIEVIDSIKFEVLFYDDGSICFSSSNKTVIIHKTEVKLLKHIYEKLEEFFD